MSTKKVRKTIGKKKPSLLKAITKAFVEMDDDWHDRIAKPIPVDIIKTEVLIDLLAREREKFTESDREKMQRYVDELVRRKVYKLSAAMKKWGSTPLKMVESYGADWHIYQEPLNCPHCQADLRDKKHGPPFKREIGQYDIRRDRTVAFVCPDCNKTIWELDQCGRNRKNSKAARTTGTVSPKGRSGKA